MKRNSITKLFSLVLVAALMATMLTACGGSQGNTTQSNDTGQTASTDSASEAGAGTDNTDGGEPYHIVMAYIGQEQPNQEQVWAKINELTKEKINMTFEPIVLGFGDYITKLNLMLSGGDKLDIVPVFYTQAGAYINAGQLVDLTDLAHEYGQGILDFMGEDVALSGSVNGFVYGFPANKESASLAGIVMRKDIVDALGIDVSAIHTYDDLTGVFEQVKAVYPELDCIAGTNFVDQIQTWDPLLDSFGVLLNDGQDTTVVNWYETDEYASRVKRINEWYRAGYVKLDAATTTESNANLVKAGSLFSYLAPIKPGYLIQENVSCGQEMITAYIGKDDGSVSNVITSTNVNFFNWGIAAQSVDKVKAMQFLNFTYTSPEWNNYMNFGIEGEDYVKVEGSDVLIDYPEGKDATTAYHLNIGWELPNQFVGYVWNGQPEDIWQQYRDFNAEATYSKAFGFFYDSSDVSTELTALSSVREEYKRSIETGSVSDVTATLKDFNDKLYSAGLQKVMDTKQEQLSAWLASK